MFAIGGEFGVWGGGQRWKIEGSRLAACVLHLEVTIVRSGLPGISLYRSLNNYQHYSLGFLIIFIPHRGPKPYSHN